MVHSENLVLSIEPDTMADSHGAYSGSAREIDGKLFIMYTGNHRDENWVGTPYQIGAWMDKNNKVSDKAILFKNPDHITEHFRDQIGRAHVLTPVSFRYLMQSYNCI